MREVRNLSVEKFVYFKMLNLPNFERVLLQQGLSSRTDLSV